MNELKSVCANNFLGKTAKNCLLLALTKTNNDLNHTVRRLQPRAKGDLTEVGLVFQGDVRS